MPAFCINGVLQSGGLPLFFGAIAGFVLIVVSQIARFVGAGTPQWIAFATWLTQ